MRPTHTHAGNRMGTEHPTLLRARVARVGHRGPASPPLSHEGSDPKRHLSPPLAGLVPQLEYLHQSISSLSVSVGASRASGVLSRVCCLGCAVSSVPSQRLSRVTGPSDSAASQPRLSRVSAVSQRLSRVAAAPRPRLSCLPTSQLSIARSDRKGHIARRGCRPHGHASSVSSSLELDSSSLELSSSLEDLAR